MDVLDGFLGYDRRKALYESIPIKIILKDDALLNSSNDDVMKGTGQIDPCCARQNGIVAERPKDVNVIKLWTSLRGSPTGAEDGGLGLDR
jgi:hypothetical protein